MGDAVRGWYDASAMRKLLDILYEDAMSLSVDLLEKKVEFHFLVGGQLREFRFKFGGGNECTRLPRCNSWRYDNRCPCK